LRLPVLPPAAGREGQRVIYGVRPGALELAKGGEGTIPSRIEVIEPTGDEILVHVLAGNTRLHAALSGRPSLAIDEPISLKPRTGSVHLFDAVSGIRLEAV
jgi:multiple sugar transport system ATP-binding protein